MFYEDHGWLMSNYQFFDLDPGDNIDEIQRFVPDVQVCFLAEAASYKDLFLLSFAVIGYILVELFGFEVQFVQYCFEKRFVDPV